MNETEAFRAASAAPISAGSGPDDPRVLRAVEEYLAALETGQAPGRDEFLDRHAGIAARLGEYLDGLDLIHRAGSAAGPMTDDGTAADDLAGAEPLGDFLLVRVLGRGGMGVVYEAVQRSLNRSVALKVLPFAAALDARQLQRFKNEAQAAAALHHPNIVPVFGVGCERSVHYYAMQLIDGQTLADMIAHLRQEVGRPAPAMVPTTPHIPDAPAPSAETVIRATASTERTPRDPAHFRRVAELGIQAAEALDHAHKVGVVHRDIKPGNLMVDQRGNLWVTDFGLAHIQSDARLTMTGDLVGTLRYMSPEQALAKRVVVDHRTDVYSLGATLYELLTLEPAYRGNDRQELLRQIAFEEPRPPRRLNRAVPAELATIVLGAMEKNPADRYATAKDLADDLRRFLADEPIRARPAGIVLRLRKWRRRHPAAVAAALMASIMVLSAGLGWMVSDRATRRQATEQAVAVPQEESVSWQQRGRLPEALAAARRADGLVRGGTPSDALKRQVQARLADLELVERLENARLEGSAVKDDRFDDELCDALFQEIFRGADIDVDALSAEEAGRRIRSTTVALELAATLDDWAMVRRIIPPQGRPWKHLLQVAREADPDDERGRVRAALAGRDRKALVALAASQDTDRLLPATMRALASALESCGAAEQAEALLRRVRQRHPDDFWANQSLARLLKKKRPRQLEEATRYFAVAVALRPQSPGARLNLGVALHDNKDEDGAIAETREAIRLKKDFAGAHSNLGAALANKGKVDEAIACIRKAIRLDPKYASAHYNLGTVLAGKGKVDEAIACYRKAIRLDPKYAKAHSNLGNALAGKGKVDEAIACYRKAIDLDPKFANAHCNLGVALNGKGKVDEAITCFRKAIDLDPKLANAHINLGVALKMQGKVDEAIACFRKALDLLPQGHPWRAGVTRQLQQSQLFQALEKKLLDVLAGKAKPASVAEQLQFAQLCQTTRRFAPAARFYAEAFETDAKQAADLQSDHRYNAACSAALAAAGEGQDAQKLRREDRLALRRQALTWLRADLAAWGRSLDSGDIGRSRVARTLEHWQKDTDLACLRDAEALKAVTAEERQACERLWADVATLLKKALEKPK